MTSTEHSAHLDEPANPPTYGADTAVSINANRPADKDIPTASTTAAPAAPDEAPNSKWPQRRLLACLAAGHLLDGCLQSIQIPFFPGEAQRRGLSLTEASTVFSCFSLTEMLTYPVMGWLAPRCGVKRLYLIGLAITGLSTVAFGLLAYVPEPRVFLASCVLTRAVEAMGSAACVTAARTIAINQFQGRLNTVMGSIESIKAVGLCIGPALGGALYALGGYSPPFYMLGGMFVGCAVISLVAMPALHEPKSDQSACQVEKSQMQSEGDKSATRHGYLQMMGVVLCCADNWLIFSLLLVVAMNWWAVDPTLSPYVLIALDMGPAELGLFYVASLSGYALSIPVWMRVADAVDNTFLLVAGYLALAILGTVLMPPVPQLGLAPSRVLLALGMLLRETFNIGAYLPMLALMLRSSVAAGLPNDLRGQALVAALFGTVYDIGRVIWPLIGAGVVGLVGLPMAASYMAAGGLTVMLTVAARGLVYQYRRWDQSTASKNQE